MKRGGLRARVSERVRSGLIRLLFGVWWLLGCSGPAFESANPTDAEIAGAPSSAGSHVVGGAVALSGAAGVASGNEAGNSESGAGGMGGAPDEPLAPCDASTWRASAFASNGSPLEPAAQAVDGDASTRWSSGTEREPGQWFGLELGAGVVLAELELQAPASPGDLPPQLALELDGKATPATLREAAPGVLRLAFSPTPATSARLVLTSSAPSWWSIAEVGGLCK